jgi:hypothetical protein
MNYSMPLTPKSLILCNLCNPYYYALKEEHDLRLQHRVFYVATTTIKVMSAFECNYLPYLNITAKPLLKLGFMDFPICLLVFLEVRTNTEPCSQSHIIYANLTR